MGRPRSGGQYKPVRGLARGLQVLRALNEAPGGELSVSSVARHTGLHRTTVRRLVETLIAEGYVRRGLSEDSIRLTLQVRSLSEGFTDDEWISEAGAGVLGELLPQVGWPSDLCTPDGDAMVVRETNHRFSRLSFHRAMVGVRLPMLLTAAGRAWLAFCGEEERLASLRLLAQSEDSRQAALARAPELVAALLRRTRRNGYGANDREWGKDMSVVAIAVPIPGAHGILGTLNMILPGRAMSSAEAARRYLPQLRAAAERISRQPKVKASGAP